jgi:arylsulfatase A-like enzyme
MNQARQLSLYRLLMFSGIVFYLAACHAPDREKPNFLIFLVDDLGSQDVGCYGQKLIETPNIDRLAAQGMKWTNAYSACPVCSPTRAAILTGKSPARVRFTGHITSIERHRHPEDSRIIPPDDLMYIPYAEVTLAEAVSPAGYQTISIGKWHVGGEGYFPTDQGFDINIGGWTHGSPPSHFDPYKDPEKAWNATIPTLQGGKTGEYLADRLTDEAIRFMKEHEDTPFLVYLSHYGVHTPLQAPAHLVEKYRPAVSNTKIDPVYAAMVDNMDTNLGRILATLDDLGLADNTVVIFASDNGALEAVSDNSPFRRGKGHLYEGGIRVPYIMRWPGHIEPGTASDNLTISEDIYTTIVDIIGHAAQPGTFLDGRSLVEDFTVTKTNDDLELHWYYPHYSPQAKTPGAAILSGSYKLIEFYDPVRIELYNLAVDIGERDELSAREPQKTREMLRKLHDWLDSTDALRPTLNPACHNGKMETD